MLTDEYAWFWAFWMLTAGLCIAETLWPACGGSADRTGRWPVNFGLGVLNGLIVSLAPPLTVFCAIWAANHNFGIVNVLQLPLWTAIPATIIVRSLVQYTFHRGAHAIPLLWRVHRVHHSDVRLDASSALRFHPLEAIAAPLFAIPFVVAFGLPPKVLAAYETVQVIVTLITHSNIRLPEAIEHHVRLLFMTPILHRFHHSADAGEFNTNYGDTFNFWDRIFGTFHAAPHGRVKPETFGLPEVGAEAAQDLFGQLRLRI